MKNKIVAACMFFLLTQAAVASPIITEILGLLIEDRGTASEVVATQEKGNSDTALLEKITNYIQNLNFGKAPEAKRLTYGHLYKLLRHPREGGDPALKASKINAPRFPPSRE